jgi:phosphomannomutase
VADASAKIAQIKQEFKDSDIDELDGVTVSSTAGQSPWWWFNVRSSNTEPLLRLNVESEDKSLCDELTSRVLGLIKS